MDLRRDRKSNSTVASRKLTPSQFSSVLRAYCHNLVRTNINRVEGVSYAHWNFIPSFRSSVLGT